MGVNGHNVPDPATHGDDDLRVCNALLAGALALSEGKVRGLEVRGLLLETVTNGDPHVLLIVRNLDSENFDVDVVVGGGLTKMGSVQKLLQKVLAAAEAGRVSEENFCDND